MTVHRETTTLGPRQRPLRETSRRECRRLAMLRRTGLFGEDTHGAKICRASALEDLLQAYRLVHDEFTRAGYMMPHESRMRIRVFEACAETATFIAKTGSKVVGSLSLIIDSPDLGLPSDACFRRELDSLRAKGLRLSETSNQAVTPAFRRTGVATELIRCAAAQNWLEYRDISMAAVSPQHSGFYKLLGFRKMSGVHSYSSTVHDPVILMGLDMNEIRQRDPNLTGGRDYVRDWLAFRNPFVEKVKAWRRVAQRRFYEPNLLRGLFVLGSYLLETCTAAELRAIRDRWGDELFLQVVGRDKAEPESTYIPVKSPDRARPERGRRITGVLPIGPKGVKTVGG